MFKITLTRYRCVNSCLYGFCLHDSKPSEKKRKHDEDSNLPNGSGYGDHIQLLQIFESWDRTNYDPVWCKENGMQVRGMVFVKDVRRQLCQIMQKISKG
jgi:ATP-dependent RNA helicase DHX8/PRP22